MTAYDPAADRVHGSGWNSAARWGGWSWSEPARGEHFRRCSFCGSIHPEDLAAERGMTADRCTACGIEGWEAHFRADLEHPYTPDGWRAEWADRKYGWPHKFYVDVPNRDPAALFCVGSSSEAKEGPYAPGGEMYRPLAERYPGQDWVAAGDLTPEQAAIIERDRSGEADFYLFSARPSHHAKFYTIHLADPAISQDVKDKIQQASGLRFTFTDDGRVGWESCAVGALCPRCSARLPAPSRTRHPSPWAPGPSPTSRASRRAGTPT
jgi:hypothetical protein